MHEMGPGVDLWSLGKKAGPGGGRDGCWWGEAGAGRGGDPEDPGRGCRELGEKGTAHQARGAEAQSPQPPLRLASSVSRSLNYG